MKLDPVAATIVFASLVGLCFALVNVLAATLWSLGWPVVGLALIVAYFFLPFRRMREAFIRLVS